MSISKSEPSANVWHFGFLFILFLLLFRVCSLSFFFLFILYLEFVVFSLPGGLLPHPKKIHTLTLCSLSTPNRKGPRRICPAIERHCDNPTMEQAAVVIPVAFKYFVKFLSLFIFSSGSLYPPYPPNPLPSSSSYLCLCPDPSAGPQRICSHIVALGFPLFHFYYNFPFPFSHFHLYFL